MTERTYNAISQITARKFAATLRRRGYQVRSSKQWVYVMAQSLDMQVGRLAKIYGMIAY
jgi:hypothetical protein